MLDGSCTVYGESNILDHLAGIELGTQEAFHTAFCQVGNYLARERIKRDRTEQTDLQAFGSSTVAEQIRADEPNATIT